MPTPPGRSFGAVASATLRQVTLGGGRLLARWPGLLVVVAAYAAVALLLYHRSYPDLWGGLAAVAAGALWYGSPLRGVEARRRARLSGAVEREPADSPD